MRTIKIRLYTEATDKPPSPTNMGKYIKIALVAGLALLIFILAGQQAVLMLMNVAEFEEQFTKPLYYSMVSALILSSIALVRINARRRSSMLWYIINTVISTASRGPGESRTIQRFGDYSLSPVQFGLWQITKILLFGAFFVNVMFGFAAVSFMDGNMLGIEHIPGLFALPFVTPPTDSSYAEETVIPMIPALVILLSPILSAIGLRLLLYVGMHGIMSMVTGYVADSSEGKARYLNYASILEMILGITVLWTGFQPLFYRQHRLQYEICGGGRPADRGRHDGVLCD